ncbi:TetR/AcrR family transcriptional regulator [Brevibacterium sp. 2SA]|uniref:TetR/AcrR family transcriptional regulator n=1 Tax=Brevibacterium sp. 2SA TaxID=2502198 RepID=UPI0010F5D1D3|nr:TetR/AcrR family transcriptional regulator [Brevibacterium sp. 2SA]
MEKKRTPREKARAETEARIVEIGNRMLDAEGAEALSLRAIARELGIVSSAVYRYVTTRDELLTILIADAFASIAEAVDAALDRDRSVTALGLAMLAWSRRFPRRWALIYGTPIAAYAAPREVTVEPGTRVMATLVTLVAEAGVADAVGVGTAGAPGTGAADVADVGVAEAAAADVADAGITREQIAGSQPTPGVERVAAELATLGIDVDAATVLRAISTWVTIVGLISSLRFGQFGPGFDDVEDDLMISVIADLGW